ncbi:hypothetical protein QVN03_08745 [Raoultella terrigena]|uniref:hypothetical protein n=1 Tax=Raoultella terrigena TaxID=577 RepID=UPI0025AF4FF1|nr:hypothetical protein [Raoultella terrigena]WJV40597.1 hypothetical protein QVN03_08745 [Raoultella terrigena]
MSNNIKTLIIVILFNKEIKESLTINSLNDIGLNNTTVHIINNGPDEVLLHDEFDLFMLNDNNRVYVFNFLENRPLSVIYNESLAKNDYDRYIFFDDDSILSQDFFLELNKGFYADVDLQLPRIIDRKTELITYPRVLGCKPFTRDGAFEIPSNTSFYSIGSGLVIYKKLIDKFTKNNLTLFDERFALYGVDLSLFRRIDKLRFKGEHIHAQVVTHIIHSLSSTSEIMTDWRYKERLYDRILSIRFYSKNKIRLFVNLVRSLFKEIFRFNLSNVILIMKTFIKGKHPRC